MFLNYSEWYLVISRLFILLSWRLQFLELVSSKKRFLWFFKCITMEFMCSGISRRATVASLARVIPWDLRFLRLDAALLWNFRFLALDSIIPSMCHCGVYGIINLPPSTFGFVTVVSLYCRVSSFLIWTVWHSNFRIFGLVTMVPYSFRVL